MAGWAVRFEDVSKRYRRGGDRFPSLRQELTNARMRMSGRLRGERTGPRGTFALDQVSFEVEEGASCALIGGNGAGKTTALRILCRISQPTGGRVLLRGRVGGLIEVGSGLHPELSGRENIWLYGTILGIPRKKIAARFDEIVDFGDLGHAIDRQVKYYSSGMQLRLGFSIASFLEPEVFVVDEALAVGDAAFQAKCIQRMNDMVTDGRTLIYVSHSLASVQELCTKAVLLDRGRVVREGDAASVVQLYVDRLASSMQDTQDDGGPVAVKDVHIRSARSGEATVATGDALGVTIDFVAADALEGAVFTLGLTDGRAGSLVVMSMLNERRSVDLPAGPHRLTCHVQSLPLLPGAYELWMAVHASRQATHYLEQRIIGTVLVSRGPAGAVLEHGSAYGPIHVPFELTLE